MRFLLDTNVFIALEPAAADAVEPGTVGALAFAKLASEGKHDLAIHPAIQADFDRDPRQARRDLRQLQSGRYAVLADPPHVLVALSDQLGDPVAGSNDWVDNQLLAALHDDRVDVLVTEDQGVHRKARRLGLDDRVLVVSDAANALRALFDTAPAPPPHVDFVGGHKPGSQHHQADLGEGDAPHVPGHHPRRRREQRREALHQRPRHRSYGRLVLDGSPR